MPTNKTQSLAPFIKFYKGMKIIIIKNLYPKIRIVNRTLVILKIFHSQNHIGFNIITLMHPPCRF
jgi:hypothetical protein